MKILWMSDSPTSPSGFGNVTRHVCTGLARLGHTIDIVGWQASARRRVGGVHGSPRATAHFGADVLLAYLQKLRPDVLVTLADVWWLTFIESPFISSFRRPRRIPWALYFPIDGDLGDELSAAELGADPAGGRPAHRDERVRRRALRPRMGDRGRDHPARRRPRRVPAARDRRRRSSGSATRTASSSSRTRGTSHGRCCRDARHRPSIRRGQARRRRPPSLRPGRPRGADTRVLLRPPSRRRLSGWATWSASRRDVDDRRRTAARATCRDLPGRRRPPARLPRRGVRAADAAGRRHRRRAARRRRHGEPGARRRPRRAVPVAAYIPINSASGAPSSTSRTRRDARYLYRDTARRREFADAGRFAQRYAWDPSSPNSGATSSRPPCRTPGSG